MILPWASYQTCKIAGCACAGNAGNVFPASAGWRSRHASRHVRHARAVMHAGIANWWFPLKSVAGKMFPAFTAHAQPTILRIWQEAHGRHNVCSFPSPQRNNTLYVYMIKLSKLCQPFLPRWAFRCNLWNRTLHFCVSYPFNNNIKADNGCPLWVFGIFFSTSGNE